jgi:hypothetical protein
VHQDEADEVSGIFSGGARYMRASGMAGLQELFETDFGPISKARAADDPFPKHFDHLKPFISQCISRICSDKPVLIVNGDNKDDTPDFDQKPVWAIVVGGAKLSRGYTVEGLTTSYYRRPAGAGDTLMQMGRWFGFRLGYRDLVRLYIGKNEPRGKVKIDLYEAFGAVCRDEEALRADLLKYKDGGLTPKQVPPLVHQHLPALPPTARNKMFNARIRSKDFSGEWAEKTSAPTKAADKAKNIALAKRLLMDATSMEKHECKLTNTKGVARKFHAYTAIASADTVAEFLENYHWAESRESVNLELAYMRDRKKAGRQQQWRILLPQLDHGKTIPPDSPEIPALSVILRSRVSDSRFGVYDEPRHRDVAQYLTTTQEATAPSVFLSANRNSDRPVLVLYFVEEIGNEKAGLSVGFGIQFPGARTNTPLTWTVADPAQSDAVVVRTQ